MFADPTLIKRGNTVHVSHGDDSGLYVEFYEGAVHDLQKSTEEGRPIYRNVEMVKIIFPADTTKTIDKPAHEGNPPYKERFARQYEAFKKQQIQVQDGTPIEHWAPITKAQALELKAMNIHTVEMLAATADVNLKWMGARQLRENARTWLAEAENGAEAIKLRNRVDELEAQLSAMMNQSAGFSASKKQEDAILLTEAAPELEAIKPIVTKMRGRPKKVEDGADVPSVNAASGK